MQDLAAAGLVQEKRPPVDPVDYTEEELAYRSALLTKLQYSYDRRGYKYPEFNDMSYNDYWETNAKAANSYSAPKKNEHDVRVVTGTTEEKDNTLLSSLLNYNINPNIEAYDQDDLPIAELGTVMEDLVRKSRKLEMPDYDVKRILIYKELLDQGTVFVEDTFVELQVPKKTLTNLKWRESADITKIEWEKTQMDVNRFCNANLITGINVYLGNMREFHMEYQPYVYTHRIIPRFEAEATYGSWPRWKYVPYGVRQSAQNTADRARPYNDWSLEIVYNDMVEEIKFYSYWLNDYMIMLNGVLMLPCGMPLSALNGVNIMPIVKGDLAPISRNFAYSKSIPAKTKVDQQVFDELLKLMVTKSRQSFEPPKANNTGQTLSKKIYFPGTMTPNIDVTKLPNLVEPTGVTNAEFQMAQFMKGIIDNKSVSPVFEGQTSKGTQTAREVVELKQQSLMKMGVPIIGVLNLEKKLGWNRLYNVIYNYTDPAKDNVYKTISIDSEFGDGLKGKRVIEFRKGALPQSEQVLAEEEIMTQRMGEPVRKVYINPDLLRSLPKYFFIEAIPTEKDTSELKKAVFNDTIKSGFMLFGPQAFNMEYWKRRWATLNGEDPTRAFAPVQQAVPPPEEQGGKPLGGNTLDQLSRAAAPQLNTASVNQLANA